MGKTLVAVIYLTFLGMVGLYIAAYFAYQIYEEYAPTIEKYATEAESVGTSVSSIGTLLSRL